ncbi:MAG: hypothetical protein K2M06_02290 [Muribaculaceae bacterium]|nr:hypothetical protein [Muribaculaceae bacterium]
MRVCRIASYPLIAAWLALGLFAAIPALAGIRDGWREYLWFGAGALGYVLLRQLRIFSKNEEWLQVFSHELAHTVVSILFFQKINSFSADSKAGRVSYSGSGVGDLFISLAPYCLPLATYILLALRLLSASESLYIYDILIGFTAAFYVMCFVAQTGLYQSDIREQGSVRGMMFIIAAWVFNATIVLVSIRGGLVGALKFVWTEYSSGVKLAWEWICGMLN